MKKTLYIVGVGYRTCDVDIGRAGATSGYWLETGDELTDDELDLVTEYCVDDRDLAEAEADARYEEWKASRWD